jgi:hypothetical protein
MADRVITIRDGRRGVPLEGDPLRLAGRESDQPREDILSA